MHKGENLVKENDGNWFQLGKGKRMFQVDKTMRPKIGRQENQGTCQGQQTEKLGDTVQRVCSEQGKS